MIVLIDNMQNIIKFIKHGVSTEECQIQYSKKYISSYDGTVEMVHPISTKVLGDKPFAIASTKFLRALDITGYSPDIRLTDTYIIIKKGSFRSQLAYSSEIRKIKRPGGRKSTFSKEAMETVKKLVPFVSTDSSRPWSRGILVKDGMAYATNNIIIVKAAIPAIDCFMPIELISMLLKVTDLEPAKLFVSNKSVAVKFCNKAYIKCKVADVKWPDIKYVFKQCKWKKTKKIPSEFAQAVKDISHFVIDDNLIIEDRKIIADSVTIDSIPLPDCCMSYYNIVKVLSVFDKCDFSSTAMALKGKDIKGCMAQKVAV